MCERQRKRLRHRQGGRKKLQEVAGGDHPELGLF